MKYALFLQKNRVLFEENVYLSESGFPPLKLHID